MHFRENNQLAGRVVRFHVRMRDANLVERVRAVQRHRQAAGGNGVEERLQDGGQEVAGLATVGREPYTAWFVSSRHAAQHRSLPPLPTIARDLHVSPGAAQYTLAVFMIGAALVQIAYGPITDTYGRKKPLLVGLCLYTIGATIYALAPTISVLIGGRFLQAFGASAGAVIAIAIARDLLMA